MVGLKSVGGWIKAHVGYKVCIYSDGQSLRTYFGKKNLNIIAFFTF